MNIPLDYAGEMGVPISFLDKYNPDQFEIIGHFNASRDHDPMYGYVQSDYAETEDGKYYNGPVLNRRRLYARIIIRNRHPETLTC